MLFCEFTYNVWVIVPFSGIKRQALNESETIMEVFRQSFLESDYILGRTTRELESDLSLAFDFSNVISVASGSSALELVMTLMFNQGHRSIATTSNTGGYATNAAFAAGMEVTIIDVDPETALMSKESLLYTLKVSDVSVVVYTHLYGNYYNFLEILDLCKARGVIVVEDCAQSLGLKFHGVYMGSQSDFATLSFYPTKNLGAIGDAGAIVAKNSNDAEMLRKMRNYGWTHKYIYSIPSSSNKRMDSIQAAIILNRLPSLSSWNLKRAEILSKFEKALHPSWGHFFRYKSTVAHLAVLRTKNRDMFIDYLSRLGIESSTHYPICDTDQEIWATKLSYSQDAFSRQLSKEVLSLPCYPQLLDVEIDYICKVISDFLPNTEVEN